MRKNSYPLVSICIPTCNGEAYLDECLKSAINQTYKNIEIIVSDDASTDNTIHIMDTFKTDIDIPVRVYNHYPKGIGANWNNCIKNSKGKFIKFLFQDDVLAPNCIEKLMKLMLTENNIAIVYARRNFIYEKENASILEFIKVYGNLHSYWSSLKVSEGVLNGKDYLRDNNFLNAPKNKIGEPTSVLLSRSCFEKVGYFNEDLKQVLDCEFWSRLLPHYNIGFVDDVLSFFRLHDSQASSVNKLDKVNETEQLYFIYYKSLISYLSKANRWKLKKRFHPLLKFLVKIKSIIKNGK